jgi:hypothetical protein
MKTTSTEHVLNGQPFLLLLGGGAALGVAVAMLAREDFARKLYWMYWTQWDSGLWGRHFDPVDSIRWEEATYRRFKYAVSVFLILMGTIFIAAGIKSV